jgi:hypothetical protein
MAEDKKFLFIMVRNCEMTIAHESDRNLTIVADRIRMQGTFSKGWATFEQFQKQDMISICDIARNTFCLTMAKFSEMSAKDKTKQQKTNFFLFITVRNCEMTIAHESDQN